MTHAQPSGSSPPLISVAMVVYNGAKDIRQAIDSVLGQRHVNLELVVVDDGSTDETWSTLLSYGERLRAVRQTNGGLPVARNTALAHARGEFIALMDHDDICHPDRLAVQLAVLNAHPEVGLVSSDFGAFNSAGAIATSYVGDYYSQCDSTKGGVRARYPAWQQLDLSDALVEADFGASQADIGHGLVYRELALGNFVHPPTIMLRRSLLERVGPFDTAMRSACDWEFTVRCAQAAPLAYIDLPLLNYRISPSQMSRSNRLNGSLHALKVALHLCEQDPTLVAQDPQRMHAHLGDMHASAAYANALERPGLALQQLRIACTRHAYRGSLIGLVLARVLLPRPVQASARQLRMRWSRSRRLPNPPANPVGRATP